MLRRQIAVPPRRIKIVQKKGMLETTHFQQPKDTTYML